MSKDFSSAVAARLTKKISVCQDFLEIAGSYNSAFILEYCFYWSQHSQYREKNTFYTKHQDIADHLSLGERTIKRVLKCLSEQGILSTKAGRAAFKFKIDEDNFEWRKTKCIFITVNPGKINDLIEQIINNSQKPQDGFIEQSVDNFQSGQNGIIEENEQFQSGQNGPIHERGQSGPIQLHLQNATTEFKPPLTPPAGGVGVGDKNGFSDFWDLFPTKQAKKACRIIWDKAKLWEKSDVILSALKKQIENDDKFNRGYNPSPKNYLLDERWEDEITLPKEQPQKIKEKFDAYLHTYGDSLKSKTRKPLTMDSGVVYDQ